MIPLLETYYIWIVGVLFILVAGALTYAAATDIKSRIIKNEVSLIIIAAFCLYALVNLSVGNTVMSAAIAPTITALIILMITSGMFAMGMMGGGDVKLMSSFALFAGPHYILPFLLYTTVCGGIVALLTVVYHQYFINREEKQKLATVDMSGDIYLATVATQTAQITNSTSGDQTVIKPKTSMKVPYGVAISSVGLWVLFQRFVEISVG
ncbi:prepilin peptidase [Kordiimonas sp. SCSIO 12610]|uniref:A24 family peptidase n=1 Tax=Kordiimonas sp. SCSIO 12610 TaxID=2829597 RepID=UPI0021096E93|nr:prepilin peptidase [Kordiimonas sp. SCSIO 12610]UTW56009.1 prepilin peptidase [Kordiimonas sp. SCSIO 12610]